MCCLTSLFSFGERGSEEEGGSEGAEVGGAAETTLSGGRGDQGEEFEEGVRDRAGEGGNLDGREAGRGKIGLGWAEEEVG